MITMSWGEKLWDKFDVVEKHTEKGIQFSRKIVQFFEEYAAKKREHAGQMRKLVKHYNVNYKKSGSTKAGGGNSPGPKEYSYEAAFYVMLDHVTEMASLEESMASDLEEKIISTAKNRHSDFMSKRKQFLSAGRDHNVKMANAIKFLETAETNFKKACKARDEAQIAFTKADNDMNVTKALVAKCEQMLKNKTEMMENSRQDYLQQLQKTNEAQRDHYFQQMPLVFSDLETLDTDRIHDLQELMHQFAKLHDDYQPHLHKCLQAVHQSADDVDVSRDLDLVIDKHQTGRFPPPDKQYVDYSLSQNATSGDPQQQGSTTAGASTAVPSSSSPQLPPHVPQAEPRLSKTFISIPTNNNNVPSSSACSSPTDPSSMDQHVQQSMSQDRSVTLAHPSNMSGASGSASGAAKEKKKRGRFLSFMSKKSKTFGGNNVQNTTSLQQDFADIAFVCDPPAQQKLKSEAKVLELNREIDKLEKERDGMLRLKNSYLTNTAYGDAKSLEPKISRVGQELDSKRIELKRYSEFLAAVKSSTSATCAASVGNNQSKSKRDSSRFSAYQPDSNYGEVPNCYSGGGGNKLRVNPAGVDSEAGSHQSHLSNHSSEDFDYDDDDDDGNYSEIPEPSGDFYGVSGGDSSCGGYGDFPRKCKVLYSYEKSTDAALSIQEGEVLDVLEPEDDNNKDGWTKVRRRNCIDDITEEGYVPTSYIKAILDYPSPNVPASPM